MQLRGVSFLIEVWMNLFGKCFLDFNISLELDDLYRAYLQGLELVLADASYFL